MVLPAHATVPEGRIVIRFMERTLNRVGNLSGFLVFSSLLLSVECVAMAYLSCIIQQLSWNVTIAIIPFCAAFSIYNLNRKTDEDEDAINHVDRFAFTKQYERPLYYGAFLTMAVCVAISVSYGIVPLVVTLTPFLLGILYSFRWLPKTLGYSRMKEIPGVKNLTVGFSWAIPLSLLPVMVNQGLPDVKTAIVFTLFFLWGFMASLIPDIRDKDGDAHAGVRTIPVIFGREKTKIILTAVLLAFGIPVILYSTLFLPASTTLLIVAANLYSHGCVCLIDRHGMLDFLADVISDGQYIFFAIAVITVTSF